MKFLNFTETRTFSHFSRFRVLPGGVTDEDGTRIRRRPPGAEPLRHPDGKSSLSQHVSHFREFGGDLRPPPFTPILYMFCVILYYFECIL